MASQPVTIFSESTLTTTGSKTVETASGIRDLLFIINVTGTPTGSTPTLQFQFAEIDPGNLTTVIGQTATSTVITAAGLQVLLFTGAITTTFRVTWTLTGTTPSFTGVNVTAVTQEAAPGSSAVSGFALGTMTTTAVTDVAVRSTTYTEPSSNAQRSVSSANAADTSVGTGARQIKLTYLDATGAGPFTETVTMNGTSAVNTVATNICFIEKIEVVSVGSGGTNAGIITLFAATAGGGGAVGTMAASTSRTFWAHHYTPSGKSSFITSIAGNNNHTSNVTVLSIRGRAIGGTAPEVIVSDYVSVGGATAQEIRTYPTPIKVPGPARLVLFGAPAGTPSIITRASFDFYDQ